MGKIFDFIYSVFFYIIMGILNYWIFMLIKVLKQPIRAFQNYDSARHVKHVDMYMIYDGLKPYHQT